jgi:hypothetical protein
MRRRFTHSAEPDGGILSCDGHRRACAPLLRMSRMNAAIQNQATRPSPSTPSPAIERRCFALKAALATQCVTFQRERERASMQHVHTLADTMMLTRVDGRRTVPCELACSACGRLWWTLWGLAHACIQVSQFTSNARVYGTVSQCKLHCGECAGGRVASALLCVAGERTLYTRGATFPQKDPSFSRVSTL